MKEFLLSHLLIKSNILFCIVKSEWLKAGINMLKLLRKGGRMILKGLRNRLAPEAEVDAF